MNGARDKRCFSTFRVVKTYKKSNSQNNVAKHSSFPWQFWIPKSDYRLCFAFLEVDVGGLKTSRHPSQRLLSNRGPNVGRSSRIVWRARLDCDGSTYVLGLDLGDDDRKEGQKAWPKFFGSCFFGEIAWEIGEQRISTENQRRQISWSFLTKLHLRDRQDSQKPEISGAKANVSSLELIVRALHLAILLALRSKWRRNLDRRFQFLVPKLWLMILYRSADCDTQNQSLENKL